jgi:hypothetical protein
MSRGSFSDSSIYPAVLIVIGLLGGLAMPSTSVEAAVIGCGVGDPLSKLLAGDSIVCGNFTFNNWGGYSVNLGGGAKTPDNTKTEITATLVRNGVDLDYSLVAGAATQWVVTAGQSQEILFNYTVTVRGTGIGKAASDLTTFAVNGQGDINFEERIRNNGVLLALLRSTSANRAAVAEFLPKNTLNIFKDFKLDAPTGMAQVTNYGQRFLITPIPSTWCMMLAGLTILGITVFRNNKALR